MNLGCASVLFHLFWTSEHIRTFLVLVSTNPPCLFWMYLSLHRILFLSMAMLKIKRQCSREDAFSVLRKFSGLRSDSSALSHVWLGLHWQPYMQCDQRISSSAALWCWKEGDSLWRALCLTCIIPLMLWPMFHNHASCVGLIKPYLGIQSDDKLQRSIFPAT